MEVKKITLDQALEELCSYKSLKNVGAAMVVHSLSFGKACTIKIAVNQVNDLWDRDVEAQSELLQDSNEFKDSSCLL